MWLFRKGILPVVFRQGPSRPPDTVDGIAVDPEGRLRSVRRSASGTTLGDERLFSILRGMSVQQWGRPCAASDLVHFRQRIREQAVEKIFKHSIDKHDRDGKDPNVSIDTTVQEKNITYPTDAKLHKKIIDKCVKIAKGQTGDSINFMIAAAGFDFKNLMVKLKEAVLWLYSYLKNMLDPEPSGNQMAFR